MVFVRSGWVEDEEYASGRQVGKADDDSAIYHTGAGSRWQVRW